MTDDILEKSAPNRGTLDEKIAALERIVRERAGTPEGEAAAGRLVVLRQQHAHLAEHQAQATLRLQNLSRTTVSADGNVTVEITIDKLTFEGGGDVISEFLREFFDG